MCDELKVIERVLNGDTDAFGILVKRYEKQIVNYVFRMIGNYQDALELSQEVFLKAYLALKSYKSEYSFSTWLYKIARNRTIDFIRKKKLNTVSIEGKGDEDGLKPQYEDSGLRPDEVYEKKRRAVLVEKAVAKLPEEYREVIIMYHVDGLKYEEISDILGLPIGTVKNRIFRARKMLKDMLEGEV